MTEGKAVCKFGGFEIITEKCNGTQPCFWLGCTFTNMAGPQQQIPG